MVIDTNRRVGMFAICTTFLALVAAELLNLVIFEPEYLPVTMRGTFSIVIIVAMPICLFVGFKMKENARLSAELQRLVNRDRLTDAATRDYFFAQMDQKPQAYGVSLMLDIDRFKAINDTYGHLAGDAVIQSVANVLSGAIRGNDILCRFGGEEFVIFLFDHGIDEGYAAAERLRKEIATGMVAFEGEEIAVTVSIGGSLKERIEDVTSAISEADAALYAAKTAGRNQTVFAGKSKTPDLCAV